MVRNRFHFDLRKKISETGFIDIVIVLWSGPFSYTSEGFPGFLRKVTY